MSNLKRIDKRKIEKSSRISKKVFISILIIELVFIIGLLLNFIYDYYSNSLGIHTVIFTTLSLFLMIVIPFICIPLLKMAFKNSEEARKSEEYVFRHLSKNYLREVVPVKGVSKLNDELTKRGRFYAKIATDNTVFILFKFDGESEKITYREISPTFFLEYFKVLSCTLK